ncbi:MAG TPA: hypothetical protein DCE42_31335 [Myxococcales bacterium]|nr:hypothetical protein [Deltaproteobacteria bacterium]MBU53489.1 hypothetical protein [Deltaproteobacteria bacterium]HAA59284.1 hypothetical protein [Myxococcales bacterium]|tara:strand:+ start:13868 stop:14224 length:357 start_codon:yes stop_codon:yes gene_type:complete
MTQKTPFSKYLREKRIEAEMSLRHLASILGVSHVYLGEVERGVHKTLPRRHWPKLINAIENITLEALEEEEAKSNPVLLSLEQVPPKYRDVGIALARRVRDQDLEEDDLEMILKLLLK